MRSNSRNAQMYVHGGGLYRNPLAASTVVVLESGDLLAEFEGEVFA